MKLVGFWSGRKGPSDLATSGGETTRHPQSSEKTGDERYESVAAVIEEGLRRRCAVIVAATCANLASTNRLVAVTNRWQASYGAWVAEVADRRGWLVSRRRPEPWPLMVLACTRKAGDTAGRDDEPRCATTAPAPTANPRRGDAATRSIRGVVRAHAEDAPGPPVGQPYADRPADGDPRALPRRRLRRRSVRRSQSTRRRPGPVARDDGAWPMVVGHPADVSPRRRGRPFRGERLVLLRGPRRRRTLDGEGHFYAFRLRTCGRMARSCTRTSGS